MRKAVSMFLLFCILLSLLLFILVPSHGQSLNARYLPIIHQAGAMKGAALTYPHPWLVGQLGASWFYDWQSSQYMDSRYVPMSWSGEDPLLPVQYAGYLLVFNEPELQTQANLTPAAAAQRYKVLKDKYQFAKLVVCGCGVWSISTGWLDQFTQQVQQLGPAYTPAGWAFHGYLEYGWTSSSLDSWWSSMRDRGEVWITEAGDPLGRVSEVQGLLQVLKRYTRYALFATEINGEEPWYRSTGWPVPPVMSLYANGQLTPLGVLYRSEE